MATATDYVTTDEHGVMRVGQTRVMLDSVLASFHEGCSAETIAQQYPSLSLEEVYGAIAFYLGHSDIVGAYLARQDTVWQQERQQWGVRWSEVKSHGTQPDLAAKRFVKAMPRG